MSTASLSRHFRSRHVQGLALAGLLGASFGLLGGGDAAQAGRYDVSYCKGLDGTPLNLNDWVRGGSAFGNTEQTEGCRANYSPMTLAFRGAVPGQTAISWELTDGRSDTTDAVVIDRWRAAGVLSLAPSVQARISNETDGYVCSSGGVGCGTNVPTDWSIDTDFPPYSTPAGGRVGQGTNRIAVQLICNTATSGSCSAAESILQVSSNVVTFRDDVAPKGSASGGALLAGGFGDAVHGTAAADVSATDTGSGVRRFVAVIDGAEVGTSPDQCAPPYQRRSPCPPTSTTSLAVDTTKVADGTHAMQLLAEDASGERGIVWSGPVVIGNNPAVGPGSDANVRGAANGGYAADDAVVTAGWSATARKPSSRRAVRRRCSRSKAYRRAHKLVCVGRAPQARLTTDYSIKRLNIVRGTLRTSTGQPISGATVQLVAVYRATGAQPQVVATDATDAAGNFVAKVPVAPGSATISVGWLARARDTVPATSVSLRRIVRAATTFTTKPKRGVRRGRVLVFRGTLRGKAGTPKGTAVAVQANPGSSWRAVTTVRASANGRWTARYRVPKQLLGRYRFRAVVSPSAAYPYGVGTSKTRRVSVR